MSNVIQFPVQKGSGDFFAVDAGVWDKLCRKGSVNMPTAYLVMARGTGHDNRTTSWSTNAIEQRTGISRPQAKLAVQKLVADGFIRIDKEGRRPRYTILPAGKTTEPDWIWLPNAIIDGAAGEVSPIELLRQSASLPALQLFVELYHAQSLAHYGGIHWRQLREVYERCRVGQRGQYVVWGFKHKTTEVFHRSAPFVVGKPVSQDRKVGEDEKTLVLWDALGILRATGLAEYVGHVIDADTDESSIVHPYAMGETGEPDERVISLEAHRAGRAMLTEGQCSWADDHNLMLLPAEQHRTEIQLVGLLRLRYRARTALTATWYDSEKWKEWAATYQRIQREQTNTCAAS